VKEFTVEVPGAFDHIEDIIALPTIRAGLRWSSLAPIAERIVVRDAKPAMSS
jgi:hypothetical protein